MNYRLLGAVTQVPLGSGIPGTVKCDDTGASRKANAMGMGCFPVRDWGNNLLTWLGRQIVCGFGGKRKHTGTGTWIKISALLNEWALQRVKAANQFRRILS